MPQGALRLQDCKSLVVCNVATLTLRRKLPKPSLVLPAGTDNKVFLCLVKHSLGDAFLPSCRLQCRSAPSCHRQASSCNSPSAAPSLFSLGIPDSQILHADVIMPQPCKACFLVQLKSDCLPLRGKAALVMRHHSHLRLVFNPAHNQHTSGSGLKRR